MIEKWRNIFLWENEIRYKYMKDVVDNWKSEDIEFICASGDSSTISSGESSRISSGESTQNDSSISGVFEEGKESDLKLFFPNLIGNLEARVSSLPR